MGGQRCLFQPLLYLGPISPGPSWSDLKRSKMAPRGFQATFLRLWKPPRALQEPFKRPSATIKQLSCNQNRFCIDFGPLKVTPGPQKSMKSIEKTMVFEEIAFSAQVASWTRFWTLLASLWGAFWLLRWLKPVLEFLLERPRAVQDNFFRPQDRSKRHPRASRKPLEAPPWPTKPF